MIERCELDIMSDDFAIENGSGKLFRSNAPECRIANILVLLTFIHRTFMVCLSQKQRTWICTFAQTHTHTPIQIHKQHICISDVIKTWRPSLSSPTSRVISREVLWLRRFARRVLRYINAHTYRMHTNTNTHSQPTLPITILQLDCGAIPIRHICYTNTHTHTRKCERRRLA